MDIDRTVTDGNDNGDVVEDDKKKGKGFVFWLVVLLIVLGGAGATGGLLGTIILREETPLPGEEFITDLGLRMLAVPGEYQDMKRPQRATISEAKGKELFEVECAMCHGQGGKGDSPLGMTMYPPAADLTRSRTTTKTDGQLFWLIAHGINLTGMPAWGTKYGGSNSDDEIWSMVAYIRSLK